MEKAVFVPCGSPCQESDDAEDIAERMSSDKVRSLVALDEKKRMVGTVLLGDLVIVKKAKQLH
jgi:predicted N-acetyltransferase YhbS